MDKSCTNKITEYAFCNKTCKLSPNTCGKWSMTNQYSNIIKTVLTEWIEDCQRI